MKRRLLNIFLLFLTVLLLAAALAGVYIVLGLQPKSEGFVASLATVSVAPVAVVAYAIQRRDQKSDAAGVILQEIRRAEEIIARYKKTPSFYFSEKLISTDHWSENVKFFVNDFSIDEVDKISNLYSLGKQIDKVVDKFFDISNAPGSRRVEKGEVTVPDQKLGDIEVDGHKESLVLDGEVVLVMDLLNQFFSQVAGEYQPIYHSTICEKLRVIARTKL